MNFGLCVLPLQGLLQFHPFHPARCPWISSLVHKLNDLATFILVLWLYSSIVWVSGSDSTHSISISSLIVSAVSHTIDVALLFSMLIYVSLGQWAFLISFQLLIWLLAELMQAYMGRRIRVRVSPPYTTLQCCQHGPLRTQDIEVVGIGSFSSVWVGWLSFIWRCWWWWLTISWWKARPWCIRQ